MKNAMEKPIPPAHAFSTVPAAESLESFETSSGLLSRLWRWLRSLQVGRGGERRLRVADTVSLGEKRFVAVVQVDGRHFLLAGGPTNIALLAQLDEKDDFGDVLKKTMTVPNAPPQPQPPPQPQQEQQQPAPKRASRAKRPSASPVAPTRGKAVARRKKANGSGFDQQPAPGKRSTKAAGPQGRFGNIPANHQGVRAFEKWLGRAVPIPAAQPAPAKTEASALREASAEKTNAPVPLPVKQTLNEWLQETLPASEKQTVKSIAEPIGQSSVEEYA